MPLKYLSGGRIQANSDDPLPVNAQDFTRLEEVDTNTFYTYYKNIPEWRKKGSPAIGGWVELGRTTLGSAGDDITVSSLPNRRYYMILDHRLKSGNADGIRRFNSDTGNNYNRRVSANGGVDSTAQSTSYFVSYNSDAFPEFGVGHVSNLSTKEKMEIYHVVHQNTTGATNAPNRQEIYAKWANTTNAISSISLLNQGTGDFNTGSEMVILGWDPTATHHTNFWQPLAEVELEVGSGSSIIDTGTIPARKYLWVQLYTKGMTGDENLTFNGDTGANYVRRLSANGAADSTNTSQNNLQNMFVGATGTVSSFGNGFIINNQSNEKLLISHVVYTAASGSGTAPSRLESACKWVNTSSQITRLTFTASSGIFGSGSFVKVWGAN